MDGYLHEIDVFAPALVGEELLPLPQAIFGSLKK